MNSTFYITNYNKEISEDHKSARMARFADYGKQSNYCMSILLYEFALISLNYLLAL